MGSIYGDGAVESLRYSVRISGVEDRDLKRELENVSVTRSLVDRPPVSETQLRRRARRDPPLFDQVLRNHGYYNPKIEWNLDLERNPLRVEYDIDPGPRYPLRRIRLVSDDSSVEMPSAEDLGLKAGEPAMASGILNASDVIIRRLRARGYAFARVSKPKVTVVHPATAVDVIYDVTPGPGYRFGDTTISGLESLRESFVRNKIPWEPGDRFDGDALSLARSRISGSGLFSAVLVEIPRKPEEGDSLPIEIELRERPHRSVRAGAGYGTDQGWRAQAGWEHRNLFHRGEHLSLDLAVSEIDRESELTFSLPDFRRLDQTLTLSLQQAMEDTRAYRSEKVDALARINRDTLSNRGYGVGIGIRYSEVRDQQEDARIFRLLYLPLSMEQDRSDDLLNPRTGTRLGLGLTPFWDPLDGGIFFVKSRVSLSVYRPLIRKKHLYWAGRVSLGTILGESRDDIPADERYFAGGGGTIRGYRYQTVGPREDGIPIGGRTRMLTSQELRWHWTESLGLVAFVDGGVVAEEALYNPEVDDVRWGAGLGLRYYTPVGPLRFDVAVPIDRRDGIDDAWQFYISLGQSF